MLYILKDGTQVQSIPIGQSSVKIGETNPDGMLTVCDRGPAPKSGRGATIICKCKCGNYTLLKLNAFRNGSTKSCGCYNKELHKKMCEKIGKKSYSKDYSKIDNPFYKFIEPTNEKNACGIYWVIECKKCGKRFKEIPSQLISLKRNRGNNPCDCYKNISKGELKIENLLKQNNLSFIKEKTFNTCIFPNTNYFAKFDFYIDNKYLIEYDGEQHFYPMSFGSQKETGTEKLLKTQERDKFKNQWCKDNNIPLIRIPYTHYNNLCIEDLKLETSKFII